MNNNQVSELSKMGSTNFSQYEKEYSKLLDPAEPLDSRTRELYRLKESILKTPAGVHILGKTVDASTNSVLLQHEVVYNIGQSGLEEACPILERVIRDQTYDPITRHEAIEALGAIASSASKAILEHYLNPANEAHAAVRESCELALQRIREREEKGDAAVQSPENCLFVSVDPAPAFNTVNTAEGKVPTTVEELEKLLCDNTGATSLYHRFQAMFSLRNIGSSEAVKALSRALREDTRSALFRHEIAFVLGQLEHPDSEAALIESLRDENEAAMVRHEAAEALGAIANPTSMATLEEFATHKEPIVRDSCVVAIEMHKYWSKFNKNVS